MKTLIFTITLLLGMVPAVSAQTAQVAQKNTMQPVTLDVQNMTCALCKFTIKKALQAVAGVRDVNVDFKSKTAQVVFDPEQTNTDALIKATTEAGYPATLRTQTGPGSQ